MTELERKAHAYGEGKHQKKTVFVPGPPSLRARLRLALIDDLVASEPEIMQQLRRQRGGIILFRDYGNWITQIKVQVAQLRTELQKAAGIRGPRLTTKDRERVGKAWKSIPIADRREIVSRWEPRAAYWLSDYEEIPVPPKEEAA